MVNTKLTLRDLEKVVNELAKQHQVLQERVNILEKTQRVSLGAFAREVPPEDLDKLKAAERDLVKSLKESGFCGSQ